MLHLGVCEIRNDRLPDRSRESCQDHVGTECETEREKQRCLCSDIVHFLITEKDIISCLREGVQVKCGGKRSLSVSTDREARLMRCPPPGAVGSRCVHEGREGHRVPAVRGDDSHPHRGAAGGIPKADEHGEAAHICGDRECAVCLPAHGEALHGADYHKKQQHPGGPGNTPTLL